MDCKIISTKRLSQGRCCGASLVEYLFGVGVGALVLSAVCAFMVFSSRSVASLMIYSDLDQKNRQTLDQMVKDFRMIAAVTNCTSNTLTCLDYDRTTVIKYNYDKSKGALIRTKGTSSNVLLTNCSRLEFTMNMRNMSNATFDFFSTTNPMECKVVTVYWCCQRSLLGRKTEDMPQTATVVIRNN